MAKLVVSMPDFAKVNLFYFCLAIALCNIAVWGEKTTGLTINIVIKNETTPGIPFPAGLYDTFLVCL